MSKFKWFSQNSATDGSNTPPLRKHKTTGFLSSLLPIKVKAKHMLLLCLAVSARKKFLKLLA